MFKRINFKTNKKIEVLDLTNELSKLNLKGNGILHVFAPHATAAIILNEAEKGLMQDFEKWVSDNFQSNWKHDRIDNNASAHLASGMLSQSVTLPVEKGEIIRGTWQNLLFLELDGPRSRRNVVFHYLKN